MIMYTSPFPLPFRAGNRHSKMASGGAILFSNHRSEPGETVTTPPSTYVTAAYTDPLEKEIEHGPSLAQKTGACLRSSAKFAGIGCGIFSMFFFVGGIIILAIGAAFLANITRGEGYVPAVCTPRSVPVVRSYCLQSGKSCYRTFPFPIELDTHITRITGAGRV